MTGMERAHPNLEYAAAEAEEAMKEALAKLPVYRGPGPVEPAPIAPDAYEPLYAE